METRLLYYFITVAREKNITRSANILHVTQHTLSRQLVQLEEELGKQLIIRNKRGIELTEAGIIFKRRAQEILDLIEKSQEEIVDSDVLRGTLSIGQGESYASYVLMPKIIKGFKKLYPLVNYDLYTGDASLIKQKIENGILDIGILLEPIEIEQFDFIRLPVKDTWGIISSKEHPFKDKEVIEPKDLVGIPLFFNKRRSTNEIESWAQEYFEQYNIIGSNNLITNVIPLLDDNNTCVISIDSVSKIHKDKLKFTPFNKPLVSTTVLVTKKDQVLSPVTKKFLEYVNEYLKNE